MAESENRLFYNLRKALVNWFPFEKGKRALLCGENTEVLESLLEKFFDEVERPNTEDLAGILSEYQKNRDFDLILAADLLEFYQGDVQDLLHRLTDCLSDSGLFLLGYRNRFGLKYLCGSLDSAVRTPFSVLSPQSELPPDSPRLFAKEEVSGMLREAGCSEIRYYYLMPDGQFPQVVYTDDYLPANSFRDRVIAYDPYSSPLMASEAELYDDVVREHTLPFVANYYLAECRKGNSLISSKHVVYAALSTDRGPEHGFATVLYSDETAEKIALDPRGAATLKTLYENLNDIQAHGLETVDQTLLKDRIRMPLVREEASLQYLKQVLRDDPEAFLTVFSEIRRDVLQSSDFCTMTDKEAEKTWGISGDELGPVLKKGYIDMIPYNAFWTGKGLRYYDQEFMEPDCPAKYVLFRAIFYTWLHIPEAEAVFPLEQVKQQFGLEKVWDRLREKEERFVEENRNYEDLRQFYEWTRTDGGAILRRRESLINKDPYRWEQTIQQVHRSQLGLLKEFDRLCRENGLRYFAVHGTLLGAVRYGGFIPWDDDVDVVMLREDYDRFIQLAQTELRNPYFLQTPENDPDCFYGGYGKLRDSNTAALEPQNTGRNCNQGIWIDVFPLDRYPTNRAARKRLQRRVTFVQRLLYAKCYHIQAGMLKEIYDTRISFYYLMRKILTKEALYHFLQILFTSCKGQEYRAILACYYGNSEIKNVFDEKDFDKLIELSFEDMKIYTSANYEKWLRQRYGEDYMIPPPEWKRVPHHCVEFHPETSYKELA